MAGVRLQIFDLLERSGIIDVIGQENIFPAQRVLMAPLNEAVARANDWLEASRERTRIDPAGEEKENGST